MQAITIKYIKACPSRGSRMVASCPQGRLGQGFNHSLTTVQQAQLLAQRLVEQLKWDVDTTWTIGDLNKDQFVYVGTPLTV